MPTQKSKSQNYNFGTNFHKNQRPIYEMAIKVCAFYQINSNLFRIRNDAYDRSGNSVSSCNALFIREDASSELLHRFDDIRRGIEAGIALREEMQHISSSPYLSTFTDFAREIRGKQ